MKKIFIVLLLTCLQFCWAAPSTSTSSDVKVWTIAGVFMPYNGVDVLVPGPLTRGSFKTGGKVVFTTKFSTTTSESEAQRYSNPVNKEHALKCLVSYCVPVSEMSQGFAVISFGALTPFGFNESMAKTWGDMLAEYDIDIFVDMVFATPGNPAEKAEITREELAEMADDFILQCSAYEDGIVKFCQQSLSDLAILNERYWQNPYIEKVNDVAIQGAKGDKGNKSGTGFDGNDNIDGEDTGDDSDGDDGYDGNSENDLNDGRNGLNGASGLRKEAISILKDGAKKALKRKNLANRNAQKYKNLAFNSLSNPKRRSNLDSLLHAYTSVLYSEIGKEFDSIYERMISSQASLINWSATSWNRLSKYMGATNAVYNAIGEDYNTVKSYYLDGVFREPQIKDSQTGLDLDISEKAYSDFNFLDRAGVIGLYYYNEEDPLFDVFGNTRKIKFHNYFDMSVDMDTSSTNVTCSFTAPINWADNVSITVKNGKLSTTGSNAWSWYEGYIRNCIIQIGGSSYSIDDTPANAAGSYFCHVTISNSDEPTIIVNDNSEKSPEELLCIKVCELKYLQNGSVHCTYQLSSVPYISCYE